MKAKILSRLPPEFPWQVQYFETLDSTNTCAKALARSGAPHGTAVLAACQTAGRGRLGRSFVSPRGGIYLSVLLRPCCTPDRLSHLTCAAAVAACDAVEKVTGLRPGIKWTNDLVCGGKKLAGILTELVTAGSDTAAIIGIGMNCSQSAEEFPPELQAMATSLSAATGQRQDPAFLAAALLEALAEMDRALFSGQQEMLERYRSGCITLGREVSLVQADTVRHGTALDILPDGALLVQLEDGSREAVNSGEVSVRGMYGYV